jgi:hypothetical protein
MNGTKGFVLAAPAVADGAVYFGAQDDDVYAVSANDGMPLWRYNPDGSVYPTPQVADGVVYAGATSRGPANDFIIALNDSKCTNVWLSVPQRLEVASSHSGASFCEVVHRRQAKPAATLAPKAGNQRLQAGGRTHYGETC